MYTTAIVNGKDSKIDIAWNATAKKWEYYGYVDIDTSLSSKTQPKKFLTGDKVQFLYDVTNMMLESSGDVIDCYRTFSILIICSSSGSLIPFLNRYPIF